MVQSQEKTGFSKVSSVLSQLWAQSYSKYFSYFQTNSHFIRQDLPDECGQYSWSRLNCQDNSITLAETRVEKDRRSSYLNSRGLFLDALNLQDD